MAQTLMLTAHGQGEPSKTFLLRPLGTRVKIMVEHDVEVRKFESSKVEVCRTWSSIRKSRSLRSGSSLTPDIPDTLLPLLNRDAVPESMDSIV